MGKLPRTLLEPIQLIEKLPSLGAIELPNWNIINFDVGKESGVHAHSFRLIRIQTSPVTETATGSATNEGQTFLAPGVLVHGIGPGQYLYLFG